MKIQFNKTKLITIAMTLISASLTSCKKSGEDVFASVAGDKTLYVSTGSCNSGTGITTYTTTATRTIERFNATSGANLGYLIDYSAAPAFIAATHPREMIDEGETLLVLGENATASSRMINRINKKDSTLVQTYYANATTLSGALRGLAKDSIGNLIIGKSTALEKLNMAPIRITAGANPWVNAPLGSCTGSNVLLTGVIAMPSASSTPGVAGKLIYGHQGATGPANRLGIVSGNGYYVAADCYAGVQISSVTHTKASNLVSQAVVFNTNSTTPTAMVYIPTPESSSIAGKLIVAYSNGQTSNYPAGVYTLNHGIVSWDVTEPSASTATLTNPVVLYDDASYVFAASAMAYDPATSSLFVAVAGEPGVINLTTNSIGYNIEKFTLNLSSLTSPTLNRVSTIVRGGNHTKCISDMKIGQ